MWSLSLVLSECSLSGRSQGQVSNFSILDVGNFSTASRQYTGDIHNSVRRRFVYDIYRTIEATQSRHGWVHMFIIYRPTVTLLTSICSGLVEVVSALLRGNWQDFNWHDASRCPSAIAELLVTKRLGIVSATCNVSISVSSRSRLGLGRKHLVHIPACTADSCSPGARPLTAPHTVSPPSDAL